MTLHHATFWRCSHQLWSNVVEGNCRQLLLKGIIGLCAHYGDAFLIFILTNQVFQHILWNILGFTYVFIQLQGIRPALVFMSLNLWIQQLARISLLWWSTLCTIHSFILRKPQIMWYLSRSQSTLIHVYQINVESQNNVLYIKSLFYCSNHL
jgi:hypothetical protein